MYSGDGSVVFDNLTFSQVTPVPSLQVAYGFVDRDTLTIPGEARVYRFSGIVGDLVTIRCTDVIGTNLNPTVQLIGADNSVLTTVTNTSQASIVDFSLPATGEYVIVISDDNNFDTGPYLITLESRQHLRTVALPVAYGFVDKDTLIAQGQVRSYKFSGTTGDFVTIRSTDPVGNNLNPTVQLIGADNSILTTVTNTSQASIVDFSLPATGEYVIVTSDDNNFETGPYLITLESRQHLRTVALPVAYGFVDQDTLIAQGETRSYKVSGTAGDLVTMRATELIGGNFNPRVQLTGVNNTDLSNVTHTVQASIVNISLPVTGEYVILVSDDNNFETGPYSLSLEATDPSRWSENWEAPNPLTRWTVSAGIWQFGTPTGGGPASAHGGANCAGTIITGGYPNNADSRLSRTATFIVPPASDNPRLRFWHWYRFDSGDYGVVEVRNSQGVWTEISKRYVSLAGGCNTWSSPSFDLSAWSGQEITVGFRFHSDASLVDVGWYIDDIAIATGPQEFAGIDGFESGLGEWSVDNGTWEVGVPSGSGPGSAHTGVNCAATKLNGSYCTGVDTTRLLRTFTVPPTSENPRLRFWQWYRFDSGDYGVVEIRDSQGVWKEISKRYVSLTGGCGTWSSPSLDLRQWAGQKVTLAFRFHSDASLVDVGWYLDDIQIATGPLAFTDPDGFESGLGEWSVDNGTWEVGIPSGPGPGVAHTGVRCAATKLNGAYCTGTDTTRLMRTFTVPPGTTNPRLRFWHWYKFDAGDYGVVEVRDSQGVWKEISKRYVTLVGGCNTWSSPSLDLRQWSGQEITLAFRFHSDASLVDVGWYLDDIEIATGPVEFVGVDGFEGGLGEWSVDNGTWEVGIPSGGPGSTHTGVRCAATKLSGSYCTGVDTTRLLRTLTVPHPAENPHLKFWQWYRFDAGDFGVVEIQDSTGAWQPIAGPYSGTGGAVWSPIDVDLGPFAGHRVTLGFRFHSSPSLIDAGWYIDDVEMTKTSAGYLSGTIFHDINSNGINDDGQGLAGWRVHVVGPSPSDSTVLTTTSGGLYTLVNPVPGSYAISESLQAGWSQTSPPGGSHNVLVDSSSVQIGGLDFGNRLIDKDTEAPMTFFDSAPGEGDTLVANPVHFEWTGTDGVTPSLSLRYSTSLDGALFGFPVVDSTANLSLVDGPHMFAVRAVDLANNVDASPESRSFVVDALPPVVTLMGPSEGMYDTLGVVTFTWLATDIVTAPEDIRFESKLDGGMFTPVADTMAMLSGLGQGPHTFMLKARDRAGHESTASRGFIVDLTHPTVQMPTARLVDNYRIRVIATGSDSQCLSGYRIQVGTDPLFASVGLDSVVGTAGRLFYQGMDGGTYYARAQSIDCAGQRSEFSVNSNAVHIPALPDLRVANITIPDTTVHSGFPVGIQWMVENPPEFGSTNVPVWHDRVFLSRSQNPNDPPEFEIGIVENPSYLAPGESYLSNRVFTLPRSADGIYYVHVFTDHDDELPETEGGNNAAVSLPLMVEITAYANLVVEELIPSDEDVTAGESITVTWKVRNAMHNVGSGRTDVSQWFDTIFLSPDSVLNASFPTGRIVFGDPPQGSVKHSGALDADSTYMASLAFTIPPLSPDGTYYVFAYADINVTAAGKSVQEDGDVFENELLFDNSRRASFTVHALPLPDLRVTDPVVPASVDEGQPITAQWRVTNNGLHPTIPTFWVDRVYASLDSLFDGNDPVVGTFAHHGTLAINGYYDTTGTFAFPKGITGDRYVFVRTDWDGRIAELDEGNNRGRSIDPVTIGVVPKPDLTPSMPAGLVVIQASGSVTLTWSVTNEGDLSTEGLTWTDGLYLSPDAVWNPASALLLGSFARKAPVAVNGSYQRVTPVPVPVTASGDYYIYCFTDRTDDVCESDETDNVSAPLHVTIEPYPPVDLVIGDVAAPDTAGYDDEVKIRWTVKNRGVASTLSSFWVDRVYASLDTTLDGGDNLLKSVGHSGVLFPVGGPNPDSAYSRETLVPLTGLAGAFYFIAQTDDVGASGDGNPDNNWQVVRTYLLPDTGAVDTLTPPPTPEPKPIVVVVDPPRPDLAISNVTGPMSQVSGQPVDVAWMVTNLRAGIAPGVSWSTTVYLSEDPGLDGGDVAIGTTSRSGPLDSLAAYQDGQEVEIPIYASGAYYLVVKVDSGSNVRETGSDSNNVNHSPPLVVTLAPPADLVVDQVTADSPVIPGQPVTIEWTIRNQGANDANGFLTDGIYASLDSELQVDDPLLGHLRRSIHLAPGASAKVSQAVDLPGSFRVNENGTISPVLPGLTPGDYRIIVWTNSRNNIRENELSNNTTASAPIQVDVESLEFDVAKVAPLSKGQARYYRLDIDEPDLDVTLSLLSDESGATNQMLVAFGRAPTPGDFDFAGPGQFTSHPDILIPSARVGSYFIMISCLALPGGVTKQTATLKATALPFSLFSVTPESGGRIGRVTTLLTGAGFKTGTIVHLRKVLEVLPDTTILSDPVLQARTVTFINTTRIEASWNLAFVPPGDYRIEAYNFVSGPEGDEFKFAAGSLDFKVEPGTALEVTTSVDGPDIIRNNATARFDFEFRNTSNQDVPRMLARILVPAETSILSIKTGDGFFQRSELYPGLFLPTTGDHYAIDNPELGTSMRVVDLVARDLRPDETVHCELSFSGFPKNPFSVRVLTAALELPEYLERELDRIERVRVAVVADPTIVDGAILALAASPTAFRNAALAKSYIATGLIAPEDTVGFFSSPYTRHLGSLSEPPGRSDELIVTARRDIFVPPGSCEIIQQDSECAEDLAPEGCALPVCAVCIDAAVSAGLVLPQPVHELIPESICEYFSSTVCAHAKIVAACDPNEIVGPAGYGDSRWINAVGRINYTVFFENLNVPNATPARKVTVTVPLPPGLDLSQFRLKGFTISGHETTIGSGVIGQGTNDSVAVYDEILFLDGPPGIRAVAGIKLGPTPQAFWVFTSRSATEGFLPLSTAIGQQGRGQVEFSILASPGVPTGTVIPVYADIQFDANSILRTNEVTNKIDNNLPASYVDEIVLQADSLTAELHFSGADGPGGAGIAGYVLYMRDDLLLPFHALPGFITGNTMTVELTRGHNFGFFTQAVDHSGNLEPLKSTPDLSRLLEPIVGVPEAPRPPVILMQNYPNPVQRSTTIEFSLQARFPVWLVVYDVAGRRVATLYDGEILDAGLHAVELQDMKLTSGVYFYKLRAGNHVSSRKMVVVR